MSEGVWVCVRVGVCVGAKGGTFCDDEAPRGTLMYVCSPGTDLIVCAVGCRWARYVCRAAACWRETLDRVYLRTPGGVLQQCVCVGTD